MLRTIFIAVLLCHSFSQMQAQSSFCGLKNKVITAGEVLKFNVFYNLSAVWVAAGQASFTTTLETLDGRPVFHITGAGNTFKSYDWIYSVRDKYETFVDTSTMLPMKFIRDVKESGNKKYEYVRFLHSQNKAFTNFKTYTVPNCVQDVLSAIYYARNINYDNYKVGDKIPFQMFLDKEVHNLYIRYLGKVKITTRYGIYNAIKISPLLIEGTIFKGGEKMEVYVSDDENRIPLRINSPILVGSIKVDLVSYSGLKYPLSSQIKKK